MICCDKFNQVLSCGDYIDVQKDGVHKIYKKNDGELYFTPYGIEVKVSSYFSNDMVKCDEVGNWITTEQVSKNRDSIYYFKQDIEGLINKWKQQQIHYEELAEKYKISEHNYKKYTYKAIATRDCWKELLKLIE